LTYSLLRKFEFDKQYNILANNEQEEDSEYGINKTAAQRILESMRAEESGDNIEGWNTMQ